MIYIYGKTAAKMCALHWCIILICSLYGEKWNFGSRVIGILTVLFFFFGSMLIYSSFQLKWNFFMVGCHVLARSGHKNKKGLSINTKMLLTRIGQISWIKPTEIEPNSTVFVKLDTRMGIWIENWRIRFDFRF